MSFHTAQHAVETIIHQYDDLTEQGVSHSAALDFIALEHGVPRRKLAAIINDRDAGLHGQSGETAYGVVANDAPKRRSFIARVQSHPAVRAVREAEKAIFFAQRYGRTPTELAAATSCPEAPPEWL